MLTFVILHAVALAVFLAIDLLWLTWIGKGFYLAEIGSLIRPEPDLAAAALFYFLFIGGLTFFATLPALRGNSLALAFGYGALFGLMTYGTYDLTNLAVMKGFTTRIAVIDLAWGTALSACTAAIAFLAGRALKLSI